MFLFDVDTGCQQLDRTVVKKEDEELPLALVCDVLFYEFVLSLVSFADYVCITVTLLQTVEASHIHLSLYNK